MHLKNSTPRPGSLTEELEEEAFALVTEAHRQVSSPDPHRPVSDAEQFLPKLIETLRRLGQPSTSGVIAEEMGCSDRDVPVLLIGMLARRGETFTCDGPYIGLARRLP
ncbi:MAG: hypothetical protein OXH09_17360 [Gammaproteobacteria bacterium]|nr:hypothetical protein [Gammaproteobacteria bacterium]